MAEVQEMLNKVRAERARMDGDETVPVLDLNAPDQHKEACRYAMAVTEWAEKREAK